MDEKVETIRDHILNGMPGRRIRHEHSGGLQKYRIEGGNSTHWLYISDEVVDDSELVNLINLINKYHVIETLTEADDSMWLFIETRGIREVDEKFAK